MVATELPGSARKRDPLAVQSVEKAFRVLEAFTSQRRTMSLSQIAEETGMDVSAAQRFTHTLKLLGYLGRDVETRRYELTAKVLDLGYNFLHGNRLIDGAMPYLMHLSKETEETVNLTILDGTDILFVSRFMSRHMLNIDVVVGSRMPAFCTAPGIAMLSCLPENEAIAIIDRSDLKAFTEFTTWKREALIEKMRISRQQGYATAFEEYYRGDGSIAAAVLDGHGRPEGAVNVAVSCSRYRPDEIPSRFSALIVAAARSISRR
ncbi:IclR family transcriptional regulator [Inquilinus sp. CAU 1745]|uniref:IclR family transcriptional regulator n=1 Tax=Inquilinus sp. CAU 1745 TaxID=3140369 RepID=UPI00325AAC55